MEQATINKQINIEGIGLHSGKNVILTLKPSSINTGITFVRIDINNKNNVIKADYIFVKETRLNTTITNEAGVSVGTVEHLVSTLYALGITNIIIEISAAEVPIFDGSSVIYVSEIQKVGILKQGVKSKNIKILKPVEVVTDKWLVKFLPNEDFIINLLIDFKDSVIGRQTYKMKVDSETYISGIFNARTFCSLEDINYLHSIGLALGGSLDNAIVVDKNRVLNKEGLRYTDEFVRHKVLDAIGDLSLCGYRIRGEFFGERSGHEANNKILHAIFSDSSNYIIED